MTPSSTVSPRLLKRFPFALLLPSIILTGVYAAIKWVTGPFFLGSNYDPDYVYLLNGLNIALGMSPNHTDHPGTPLQLLGAAWIRLHNIGVSRVETAADTIANSEARLNQLNLVLFAFLICAVTAGSYLTYFKSRNLPLALLSSAGLLFLGIDIFCLGRFNPEALLWLNAYALGLSTYWYCCLDQTSHPTLELQSHDRRSLIFAVLAAFCVATGSATKINFAPLGFLPALLLRGWRFKLAYVLFTFVFLALWLIPDYGQLTRMAGWVEGLVLRTQRYGSGPSGLLETHSFLRNAIALVAINPPYFLLISSSFILAIPGIFRTQNTPGTACKNLATTSPEGVLLAVSCCELLQFLITCKFQLSRYLVPGIGLSGLNVLILLYSGGFLYARRWLKPLVAALLLTGTVVVGVGIVRLNQRSSESLDTFFVVQNYRGQPRRIYGYGASSPFYALYFGNSFSGWSYGELLYQMIPESNRVFFYNSLAGNFANYRGEIVPRDVFSSGGPVIFQSHPFGGDDPLYNSPAGLILTPEFGGPYDEVYAVNAVVVPKSPQGK